MEPAKIENVQIIETMLGIGYHGIFTFMLYLEGDGWRAGFGGYALDRWDWDVARIRRIPTLEGVDAIKRILETVGVNKWEQLKGQHIRCLKPGRGESCKAIGHIHKKKWFGSDFLGRINIDYEEFC